MSFELPPKQSGPSAWMGSDLADDDSWVWQLTESEIRSVLGRRMDSAVLEKVQGLRSELIDGRGFRLIRGLPVADLSVDEVGALFSWFGSLIGSTRSQNAAGDLLGHVRNVGADADDPTARIYQTDRRQTFHTDSCDVVGLMCVETAESGGDSLLVSAATIYNRMLETNPELTAVLFQPVATDRRGEVPPGERGFFTIPVLNWFEQKLTVLYQRQYIESASRFRYAPVLTDEVIAALDLFDSIANDPQIYLPMTLEVGDMQFVHNHSLLHDRTGFIDKPGSPRHLLRLWLTVPGDRALPEVFAQRYGSVEVGNRGGIHVG
ncbi:MAG: TauD/TfdA family dioxygenase [Acidimicrobiales bacterium]|nr:TauD/TfdA family dioxygenase [Acidimicrobiales bacterium]